MFDPRQALVEGASKPPVFRFFSFTCVCCEATENRKEATAPAGWVIRYSDDASYVFCPDCAADPAQEEVQ